MTKTCAEPLCVHYRPFGYGSLEMIYGFIGQCLWWANTRPPSLGSWDATPRDMACVRRDCPAHRVAAESDCEVK